MKINERCKRLIRPVCRSIDHLATTLTVPSPSSKHQRGRKKAEPELHINDFYNNDADDEMTGILGDPTFDCVLCWFGWEDWGTWEGIISVPPASACGRFLRTLKNKFRTKKKLAHCSCEVDVLNIVIRVLLMSKNMKFLCLKTIKRQIYCSASSHINQS